MHYIDGKMIKELREREKLTQAALADRIHVSDKTISKWETGRGFPDINILPDLAEALKVSVVELLAGEDVKNNNVSSNMKKSLFHVCPVCGNVIHSVGEGVFSCHGIQLPALEAEECDDEHVIEVSCIENEYYVTMKHSMTKERYIFFVAYITPDSTQLVKLYPEQDIQVRFMKKGHGILYAYDNVNGLYQKTV